MKTRLNSPATWLMIIATGLYVWLTWMSMGAFQIFVPEDQWRHLPLITRIGLFQPLDFPFHALLWQLLAVGLLVVQLIRPTQTNGSSPLLMQISTLFCLLLLQGVAWLSAIYLIGHQLR